ncbi:hypothetical protein FRAAL2814 [Frankia alni ACN14a]|uniref:Uncharacterized protein n=1 Tax=Frankia alni (strain DSM 45986 / CECT 9034 / ACN14a) TaxID=326424 RepID=Q0RLZ5_FRAAA|nr:hypothetical protein FRAAL2814 [Frankia alni ACN14a]
MGRPPFPLRPSDIDPFGISPAVGRARTYGRLVTNAMDEAPCHAPCAILAIAQRPRSATAQQTVTGAGRLAVAV